MTSTMNLESAYAHACEQYASLGVDVERALVALRSVSLSLHCWQGDDVRGFEQKPGAASSGGIQVTGGYPGAARTIDELKKDLQQAYALIPGSHRLNLHAMYGDFGGKAVDRDKIEPSHFRTWMDWCREQRLGLDFNATCFAHPRADSGFTLSSADAGTRDFWIEHVRRTREIGAVIGKTLGTACIHNLWIPDGAKDVTMRRSHHRAILKNSLDAVFARSYDRDDLRDAVESKLFGIGSESFVVGSHEFYMGYALSRRLMLCLDMGHFHPTESVADKISALLPFVDDLLLHVSRGVRWDSDHVVIFNDDVASLAEEIIRAEALERVKIALDFFDGSMNRIGAWVLGSRSTLKALLRALLEPRDRLMSLEAEGNLFARMALLEDLKMMPVGIVWDYYCDREGVPTGEPLRDAIQSYEKKVLAQRG
ncbi:MAG: L-rhamnose isomerase [Bacteroidetes bacterium]|nr:L-rhamnose isomerase [Bacteroidota bacterium]